MRNEHIMRYDYEERYGHNNKLVLYKTILYDDRDYTAGEIEEAVVEGISNELQGVIECSTADYEQCFRSLLN